jgi:hypothetical protein
MWAMRNNILADKSEGKYHLKDLSINGPLADLKEIARGRVE